MLGPGNTEKLSPFWKKRRKKKHPPGRQTCKKGTTAKWDNGIINLCEREIINVLKTGSKEKKNDEYLSSCVCPYFLA